MHVARRLCIPMFCTHVRQEALGCARTMHGCYVGTTVSNLRPYRTTALVQKPSRIRNILIASTIFLGAGLGYIEITDSRASVHWWLAVPLVRAIWPDAEDAHEGGVRLLKDLHRMAFILEKGVGRTMQKTLRRKFLATRWSIHWVSQAA